MNIKLNSQNILLFLLFASFSALILAYISQYGFGLQPCQLCHWQRYPFFAVIAISILFLTVPFFIKNQNIGIQLGIFLLFINSLIAFYHSGVEKKWFKGFDSCAIIEEEHQTIEELKISLQNTKAVRCDEPQFVFLGFSMAGWNLIYCFIIAFSARRLFKKLQSSPINDN